MSQVTPRTTDLERRARAAREAMGDRYVLAQPVERKTPAKSREQLARDWNERKRLAGMTA